MSRRRAAAGVRAVAEARLAAVAGQWRPAAPSDDPPAPVAPMRMRGWSGPALRGLAVLTGAVLAIAGYAAWQAQPREVVEAPITLATGPALTGASVTGTDPGPPTDSAPADSAPADSPAAVPAPPPSPTAVAEVVVHVTGLVARPGLVRLPAGSRVADAIAEAGGVTQRRAADSVNLARVLADGEQVVVSLTPGPQGQPAALSAGTAAPAVIDLNAATAESLDALPGVGPVIAARIVAWRAANGPFRSIEELGEVSGIGDAILAQLRPLVRV